MIKPIEELTITDDFMFGAVMRDPKCCKPLLEMALGVKIREIRYPELQKSVNERYASKSVRLDAYLEDAAGTVYDVEIQTTDKRNLPKRMRYYQGLIDLHILEKGEDYASLRKSFVIFICTYDPFGAGRYIYEFENRCRQDLRLALGDGAAKVVLNTKGRTGEAGAELKALLRYMDGAAPETDYTRALDKAVTSVRQDEKWRVEYMSLNEMLREQKRLGEYKGRVALVRTFRDEFQPETLAKLAFVTPELLASILNIIDAHPDWDDEQVAESVRFE